MATINNPYAPQPEPVQENIINNPYKQVTPSVINNPYNINKAIEDYQLPSSNNKYQTFCGT